MATQQRRCPKCLYLRHSNDDGKAPPDVCPRCGKIYEKAKKHVEHEQRERSFRAHKTLEFRYCGNCHEPVSIYASNCPHCDATMAKPRHRELSMIAAGLLLVIGGLHLKLPAKPKSPLPQVSFAIFERCATLSADLKDAQARDGAGAPATLRIQNQWHAECSRKALRELAEKSAQPLPITPDDWLALRKS